MSGLLSEEVLSLYRQTERPADGKSSRGAIYANMPLPPAIDRQNISMATSPHRYSICILFWDVVPLTSCLPMACRLILCCLKFPLEKPWRAASTSPITNLLNPGDWLNATRTLTDIYEKSGRSGPLIFYEVLMEVRDDDGSAGGH